MNLPEFWHKASPVNKKISRPTWFPTRHPESLNYRYVESV